MLLSIIIIGDEILLGQVRDTNSGFISSFLGSRGWKTRRVLTVGDNGVQIRQAVELAMSDSDLVICTGGLGPTKDDITKNVLAEYFDSKIIYSEEVAENVRRIFEKRGFDLNRLTRLQAMVPEKCEVIQNLFGTAPLMWFEKPDDKASSGVHVLLSMPGVPYETENMLLGEAGRKISRRFYPDKVYFHRTLMVFGITESALAEKLEFFEKSLPENFHLAYLPDAGIIRLRLDGASDVDIENRLMAEGEELFRKLEDILGDLVVCDRDIPLAEVVLESLRAEGHSLATAESCTGGNIARLITSRPGCSDVYVGSVVSYSNDVKRGLLGVKEEDLSAYGAVSEQVVLQMAEGVCRVTGAYASVATSGIAGPSGGSEEKPVGTVWISAHAGSRSIARLYHFAGSRARIIERASNAALALLLSLLGK